MVRSEQIHIMRTVTSTVSTRAGGRDAAQPLYAQVASEVRHQIQRGVLRAGDKLPSIRAVCRSRGVSTATATEAYLRLERDGYVRVRDRSGFYVIDPPERVAPEPHAAEALEPPVPVGIGAFVLGVLRTALDPRRVSLGVS